MELRNHPVMFCDGVKTWPAKWLHPYGIGLRLVSGEVGVLDAVFLSHVSINRVALLITEGEHCYLGTLMLEKHESAKAVFEFLYVRSINRSQVSALWICPKLLVNRLGLLRWNRRHIDSQTWHFCSACSHWPREFDFVILENFGRMPKYAATVLC